MILRCELCGGDLTIDMDKGIATCQYCQSVMTLSGMEEYEKKQKIDTLMNRAFMFIEDSSFGKASDLLDEVLLLDGKLAKAYVGKLMVQLKCAKESQLGDSPRALTDYSNYTRALNFAGDDYKEILEGYNTTIVNRIEDEKLYQEIVKRFGEMQSQGGLTQLIGMFGAFHTEKNLYKNLKVEIERTLAQEVKIQELLNAVNAEKELIESSSTENDVENDLVSKIYELDKRVEAEVEECYYLYCKKLRWFKKKTEHLKETKAKMQADIDELQFQLKECGFFDMQKKKAISETVKVCKSELAKVEKDIAAKPPVAYSEMNLLVEMFNRTREKPLQTNYEFEDYKIENLTKLYDIKLQAEKALETKDLGRIKELLRLEEVPSQIHKQRERYMQVLEDINNRQFGKAFSELIFLHKYRNAAELFDKCVTMPGAVIRFGQYDWRVLDRQENKWLLIMDKLLPGSLVEEDPTQPANWATSSVRQWLNREFLEECFNRIERGQILNTTIEDENCGNVEDKVFLLSIAEAEKYFVCDKDRQAAFDNNAAGEDWNLRSPGKSSSKFAYVSNAGNVIVSGLDLVGMDNGIRPAMWIEIKV